MKKRKNYVFFSLIKFKNINLNIIILLMYILYIPMHVCMCVYIRVGDFKIFLFI